MRGRCAPPKIGPPAQFFIVVLLVPVPNQLEEHFQKTPHQHGRLEFLSEVKIYVLKQFMVLTLATRFEMAAAPNCGAVTDAREPWNVPNGVRLVAAMNTGRNDELI